MTENEISYLIRGCIFEVYNHLGPGLLESVYLNALCVEFELKGIQYRKEMGLLVFYKGRKLDLGFRVDLFVESKVIIEVKSLENILDRHHLIVLNYVRLLKMKLGILVNFNTLEIEKSIFRKVNNL
ncbi:MAG: GxxExxY protein [Chitinophagales bacterium]